jgi:[acyl-carrier-protein] S-malonyltransferase
MGIELAARWPSVAKRFAEASEILGWDLKALCEQGPEDRLADTRNSQPALFTVGYAVFEVLSSAGFAPRFVAGHSLGEYTACAAAGCISFPDGVRAVKRRGEIMGEAGTRAPGAMAAVIGARPEDLEAWVTEAGSAGPIVVANRNAPDQVVVSGAVPAVEALQALAKKGGVRAIRLKVSGAFHSPLMREAGEAMRDFLKGMAVAEPRVPIIGNVAALALRTASQVREELESQMTSAVRWDAVVRALAGNGVRKAVESGPGRVLSGLIRKTDPSLVCLATGSAGELEETLAALQQEVG